MASSKHKNCFLLGLSFLVCVTLGRSQSLPKLEELTLADGLSQGFVKCLLQDKEGFIWLGTKNGLNRYDGSRIKT
ncbi:MAG TPA: two-component regulator propeller domain-containing protein, partial [bacterium]|nr:two-component regulator propeller domain-containing protein [bacterium]